MYTQNEKNCRKLTKQISYYLMIHQAIFVKLYIYSIYCIAFGNFDTSTPLPVVMSVPFNAQTIWGWHLKCFLEFFMALTYAITLVSLTSYFVCCCLYIGAICNHFEFLMHSIRDDVHRNHAEKNLPKQHKLNRQTQANLVQAIQLHVKLIE